MRYVVFGNGGRILYEGYDGAMASAVCDDVDLRGEDWFILYELF